MKFAYDEPLGLPRGSVRAIVTILIVIGAILHSVLNNANIGVLELLAASVVSYYFGSRASETNGTEPDRALPDAV